MSTHDTIPYPGIPFLPGNTFFDVNKTDFRKPHSLDYTNGYAVRRRPTLGIGLTLLPDATEPEPSTLLAKLRASNSARPSTPATSYAAQTQHQTSPARPRFVPAHVAFDKVVLRFDAYFKQTVHESAEQYHLRRVRIHYFVEDDSIAVVEPPVENSGFPQGVLIKRQRLPKSPDCFYDVRDFDRGKNVVFYGKTFRIVSCDEFTERYMLETEGIRLSPVEHMPDDPYQASRTRPARGRTLAERKDDRLRRFLENDRKVLRFFCVWDDRDSMFGEAREFVLHYYLVDDCVEVREVQKPNDGRDPFPILLRKQRLPKAFKDLS
ncbi:EF-hand domain-containing protein 1, partial [Cladochytrium tenue]